MKYTNGCKLQAKSQPSIIHSDSSSSYIIHPSIYPLAVHCIIHPSSFTPCILAVLLCIIVSRIPPPQLLLSLHSRGLDFHNTSTWSLFCSRTQAFIHKCLFLDRFYAYNNTDPNWYFNEIIWDVWSLLYITTNQCKHRIAAMPQNYLPVISKNRYC
jgi:hypothetical protein